MIVVIIMMTMRTFCGNIQGSDKQVELIYSAVDCAHLPQPSKRSRW